MEPNEFRIVQNLQQALQGIAIAGGYHFDVLSTAVKLDPNCNVESLIAPGGPRPFIVIEVKPDGFTYSPAKRTTVALPLTIHWVSDSTPTDDTSRLQTFYRGLADVERAIVADVSRGGFAIDTEITKRTYSTAVDRSQVWSMTDVEVKTRRVYGQPDV
jgi:hypothetical protein